MTLTAAHFLAPETFGKVAAGTALIFVFVAVQRAAIGEPLLVLVVSAERRMQLEAAGTKLAVLLSLATAATCAALSRVLPYSGLLLALAFGGAAIVFQDFLRYVAMTRKRAHVAVVSDSVWLIEQVLAFAAFHYGVLVPSAEIVVLLWGLGALFGTVAVIPRLRVGTLGRIRHWFEELRGYSLWSAAQVAGVNLVSQATIFALAGITGFDDVGGLRAMSTLLQPIGLILAAMIPVLAPRLAAIRHLRAKFLRSVAASSIQLSLITIVVGGFIVVFGKPLVGVVFGPDYIRFADMLDMLALAYLLQAAGIPVGAGLRAKNAGRSLFTTQLSCSVIGMVAVVVLAGQIGIAGAAVGMVLQSTTWLLAATRSLGRGD